MYLTKKRFFLANMQNQIHVDGTGGAPVEKKKSNQPSQSEGDKFFRELFGLPSSETVNECNNAHNFLIVCTFCIYVSGALITSLKNCFVMCPMRVVIVDLINYGVGLYHLLSGNKLFSF